MAGWMVGCMAGEGGWGKNKPKGDGEWGQARKYDSCLGIQAIRLMPQKTTLIG